MIKCEGLVKGRRGKGFVFILSSQILFTLLLVGLRVFPRKDASSFLSGRISAVETRSSYKQNSKRRSPAVVAVVKACLGSSFEGIANVSLDNGQKYARKHLYDFHEVNEETYPETTFFTPQAWIKVAYLKKLIDANKSYEWILWLDCDALVLRPEVSVASMLESLNVTVKHDLIFTEDDPNNRRIAPFNSGVFLMRNSSWAREELGHVLRLASQEDIRNHGLWEQEAFRRLYVENAHNEQRRILVAPMRWKFNAFDRLAEVTADTVIWHRTACRTQPHCDEKFLMKAKTVLPMFI